MPTLPVENSRQVAKTGEPPTICGSIFVVTEAVDKSNRTVDEELPGPLVKFDEFQQSHAFLAVPVAVWRKFADDQAGKLAALISYFAFLSIFPLLIVFATITSKVLAGNPEMADKIVKSAAGSFLSVGNPDGGFEPLNINGFALVIGVVVGLWSGLAVANNMQDAMNKVYEVPREDEPGFAPRALRSVVLLIIVGVGLPGVTVVSGILGAQLGGHPIMKLLLQLVVLLLTIGVMCLSFRRATVAVTTWRGVLPGAAIAALAWVIMQNFATALLSSKISGSQSTYGPFALVIGLLFWFFLLAQVTLYCAELNIVLQRKLWPRGLRAGKREVVEGTVATVETESPQ